jgi:D-alanine-D-alanine ligase-like ATP-grasp enzyme
MCSVRRKINLNGRKDCFEVFGYDFMIDAAHKTWLIEVNTNPAIEECSSVLKSLIPRMIDDMFKLTVDKILNLTYREPR